MNEQGIYWLASYPKSGNTWFRIVLSNILRPKNIEFNLNQIDSTIIPCSRPWLNQITGFNTQYLSDDELDKLRPDICEWFAQNSEKIEYLKIHDAYTYPGLEGAIVPKTGTRGALYFIRNPLDVVLSYANFSCCSVDEMIAIMANPSFNVPLEFERDVLARHYLLSWSLHVQSWVENHDIPVKVIRYEDMLLNSYQTFREAIDFLQLDVSEEDLKNAIEQASFSQLQKKEQSEGFKEKPFEGQPFFRKGIAGDWENQLTPVQVQSIIEQHHDVMQKFGYLDEHLKPIRFHHQEKEEC